MENNVQLWKWKLIETGISSHVPHTGVGWKFTFLSHFHEFIFYFRWWITGVHRIHSHFRRNFRITNLSLWHIDALWIIEKQFPWSQTNISSIFPLAHLKWWMANNENVRRHFVVSIILSMSDGVAFRSRHIIINFGMEEGAKLQLQQRIHMYRKQWPECINNLLSFHK